MAGLAQFEYVGDPLTPGGMDLWGNGKVFGFASDASIEIVTDNPYTADEPFTGTFRAERFTGGRNNSDSEQLNGTVSGFSYSTTYGIAYLMTVTVTGGTGKLGGASGTIYVSIYQQGYLDPADHPNNFGYRLDTEFSSNGSYMLP
jgi:hypothetical protein